VEWNFFSLYISPAPEDIEELPTITQKKVTSATWRIIHNGLHY